MANMFWNLDKISETTAIHSGFRLCPIISHSSIRQTMTTPVKVLVLPTHNRSLFNIKIYIYGGLRNVNF